MSNPTPSTGTQLTPVTSSLNKLSSLLTPAVYGYTLDSSSTNQINKAISFNYDITTGLSNYAIQFYNQGPTGNNNGIEISDSYSNSIIGNSNGIDLDFSANNLFKFTSSKGISVNNNISCNDISCNDISCNDISCNDISCNQLKITPTNTISTTSVPYGLYVDSPLIKTYPLTTSFSAYPLYRTTAELGTNQTYLPSISTGFNFIYGDSRSYTKSAVTTSDIERLFFTGFEQSFNWTDFNTCKQYLGINDSFTYSGINANTRVSSIFRADSITLDCPTSYTQTITNIRCRDFRINASNANATYNITNSISTNLQFIGNATNVIANISNHSFFENSSSWDVSLNVVGGSLATITNMYGLKLNTPNGGTTTGLTITNNWGIYSGWALARNYFAGVVTIGTTNPSSSAILQLNSTTQGFLPPRMTGAQANAIVTPAEGLMVYITNTTSPFSTKGWWGYNGANWTQIG
jgi:uncharacterized membrane protein